MKKKLSDTKFLLKVLFVFLVIQPFLDTSFLYSDKVISIFHFSPTTIIRFGFVFFLLGATFFIPVDKKYKKIFIINSLFLFIYTIIHIMYSKFLTINNYDSFNFSVVTELMYILRMFLPITIIYLICILKPTKKQFFNMITNLSYVISLLMIITNIFKIADMSYGYGRIVGNFFDWFINYHHYSSELLASKAFFNSANQISGLMVLILPLLTLNLLEEVNFKNIMSVILFVISMIMMGTRTTTFGWILCILMVLFVYLFLVFIKKKKFEIIRFLIIDSVLVVGIFITFFFAPLVSVERQIEFNAVDTKAEENVQEIASSLKKINSDDVSEEEKERIKGSIDCYDENDSVKIVCLVKLLSINSMYYTRIYPVEDHEDFWDYFMFDVSPELKYGQRNIQKLINKDVIKNNKKTLTPVLGYGYSRYINAYLYPEHDFYIHYYTVGIIGIILFLCPYLFISLLALYKNILKKRFNFIEIVLSGTICEVILISILTGHIVDELIVSMFLGAISGYLLLSISRRVNN